MIMTTTPGIEGRKIKRYCGLVTGEAVMGASVFKDSFATVTDVVAGRGAAYGNELKKTRELALKDLNEAAIAAGASAILAVSIGYEVMNGMLMVTAAGTAVLMEGELH
jgi:uncharacterized protein YbjQ (UPF0145 family)